MKRLINQRKYTCSFDTCFVDTIKNCAHIKRKNEEGTWISQQIISAYQKLHQLGIAHSVEIKNIDNELVGGLYGISIGKIFYGESMFSKESNTSKLAFIFLSEYLKCKGHQLIDCQITNPHLLKMGAEEMPRSTFLELNKLLSSEPSHIGCWSQDFETFLTSYFAK